MAGERTVNLPEHGLPGAAGGRERPPIILVTHEFYPRQGGIATFCAEIARAGARLGHSIEVWAPTGRADRPEPAWPFPVRRLPIQGTHGPRCVAVTLRELVRQRARVRGATLYVAEPGPMRAAMALLPFPRLLPARLLLTFHGSEILKFGGNPIMRALTRRLIRRADRISVLTTYTRDLLCRRFPEAARKTIVTPGAVRSDLRLDLPRPERAPDGQIVVLTVARLHPRKGQLFVIEALQGLPENQRRRVEYQLAGFGTNAAYETRLREVAGRSGVAVRFLGSVPDDDLGRLYAHADIFAMTSIDHRQSVEGFGLVYLEASAHGLPVVAHAVGGVPEAVVDGVTGLLVPPGDRAALTAAFSRLIADPALRRTLGENGRAWALRNDWTRSAEALFSETAPDTALSSP